jgi:hypothetical protein
MPVVRERAKTIKVGTPLLAHVGNRIKVKIEALALSN